MGTAGYNWVQLGTTGYSWVHLGTAGYSWVQLGAAGYSWVQLGTAGYSSVQLGTAGYSWVHLGTARYSWVQLGTAGYNRVRLGTAGCSWVQSHNEPSYVSLKPVYLSGPLATQRKLALPSNSNVHSKRSHPKNSTSTSFHQLCYPCLVYILASVVPRPVQYLVL
jgi:hypothetical protein